MGKVLRRFAVPAAGILMAVGALSSESAVAASDAHASVVSEDPANYTPNLLSDDVVQKPATYALAQSEGKIYVGGSFHAVENANRTITYIRTHIFSFDAITGGVTSFGPTFDGPVWAIAASGSSLYVGGAFSNVNGLARKALVKIDASTGAVDQTFNARIKSGKITDVRLVDGRLIVGGTFSKKLAALDPVTGADTGYINIPITGSLSDRAGATDVYRFAVNPAGDRLVAIGNFASVGEQTRYRAFMLNLGATGVSLNEWYYQPLMNMCKADSLPQYLRDVDFSPDGSYFVFVSTGWVPRSHDRIGLDVCDAVARFETAVPNPAKPTWINYTGGDTLHSVTATGAAVYVQGHQRWMDNAYGQDSAGKGAVERKGIAAVDPGTGKALPWNPSKTRAVGGRDFLVTPSGVWVGSDGARFAGEYRKGIAFCPV